ncbi:ABC transporter substrate-binding protein [Paratissierella segnis]|uniref:ABC transporter substrate-binding protein n=1 Tax=Paratissierella segnis TaxID=2763679 RepID=A0A926IJP8_9FIRM|nr:ABC transporter substrate-binding protein [Paratissierella segnis]MBC8586888.1 ABC transporter substrate-binding protein [Paratissierella segnis]
MKKGKVKSLIAVVMVGVLMLSGCTNSGSKASSKAQKYTIGISQLSEHPALDDARLGFIDGLKELGVDAEIIYQNAQGEIPNTLSIAQKFVKDEVDLIYAIATPAAQSAKQATDDIPIIFSAVTDPVESELVDSMKHPGGNVTGTSDLAPTKSQLQMFKQIDPNIKKIGILYNTGENNSEVQIDEVKSLAPDEGLEVITVGISTINEIPQAVDSIIKKVDAIYTITDNMVASAINVVAQKAVENNLITVGAEDSHVKGGILITDGISYYELGKQSAKMAQEILVNNKAPGELPSETSANTKKVFNENTLKSLKLDENDEVFKTSEKIK